MEHLRDRDWGAALSADGEVDPAAQVAELTGILRRGPGGDRLANWPTDIRLIVRRVPRPASKPATLGEHPDWEYGAFVTNTGAGQVQFLDARHRTQAHVETESSSSRPAARVTCPRSTTTAAAPGCSWPPWPPR